MPRESKRDKILNAAADIVLNHGTEALTLDAVANLAEVSKGGLLYHFSTKEALITGLVQRMDRNQRQKVEDTTLSDKTQIGKWSRSYIQTMYNQSLENKRLTAGMLAAQAFDPQLLKPLQETHQNFQNLIQNDGIDEVQAMILKLAIDGLWLSETFGLGNIDVDLKKRVMTTLLQQSKKKK
ncbi:TetR/AcrR family transcriptional regulator [Halobacillus sp. BBL2006]|uniref:TetR/AcrR family transcriptional regulator n=1 Tax=Halobacillus sp. BBL2006 TaxID=1543706 RepID=UPI00054449E0|nr:TetR/AcrR family transcriptional regulator [Halobacillus sp. BBL2006]KHE73297.1 TetR family transcriptional regulator [Halobacillus sp. BBL2006]